MKSNRAIKIRIMALYVVGFVAALTLIGTFAPIAVETYLPAEFWLVVKEARIVSFDPPTATAKYVWRRETRNDLIATTHIELVCCQGDEELLYRQDYRDVLYEEGEHRFVFDFPGFPDLPPGEYQLHGVTCFETPSGVKKRLSWEFSPYIVETPPGEHES